MNDQNCNDKKRMSHDDVVGRRMLSTMTTDGRDRKLREDTLDTGGCTGHGGIPTRPQRSRCWWRHWRPEVADDDVGRMRPEVVWRHTRHWGVRRTWQYLDPTAVEQMLMTSQRGSHVTKPPPLWFPHQQGTGKLGGE